MCHRKCVTLSTRCSLFHHVFLFATLLYSQILTYKLATNAHTQTHNSSNFKKYNLGLLSATANRWRIPNNIFAFQSKTKNLNARIWTYNILIDVNYNCCLYTWIRFLSSIIYYFVNGVNTRVKSVRLALSDALLEDLQTSVSRSATPSRDRVLSPQVEYRVAANPTRVVSEGGRWERNKVLWIGR